MARYRHPLRVTSSAQGAVEERVHRGAGSGASTDVLRDWRPVPRDRRGVGRLPSRSALIWRTTRSRTGGAGAIETPTPGAVPDFIPVVGRYRTTATWRLSFHCGMNAADTSAWRGIRIGCASAPRLDAVRTSPRSCQATITRPHGSWRHLASLRVQASIERCIGKID